MGSLILYVASLVISLIGIGWGLPSAARMEAIGIRPSADQARADWERVARPSDRSGSGQLPDTPDRTSRRFALYTEDPDESVTLMAVARLVSRGDPGFVQYGPVYLAAMGGALGVAHVLGVAHLRRDIVFYVDNPNEVGRLYLVMRVAGALVGCLTFPLLFLTLRDLCGAGGAAAGVLAAMLSPWWVAWSHVAKPLAFGTALVAAALWLGLRRRKKCPSIWGCCIASGLLIATSWVAVQYGVLFALAMGLSCRKFVNRGLMVGVGLLAPALVLGMNWRAWRGIILWESSGLSLADWAFTARLVLPAIVISTAAVVAWLWSRATWPHRSLLISVLLWPTVISGMLFINFVGSNVRFWSGLWITGLVPPHESVGVPAGLAPFRSAYFDMAKHPPRAMKGGDGTELRQPNEGRIPNSQIEGLPMTPPPLASGGGEPQYFVVAERGIEEIPGYSKMQEWGGRSWLDRAARAVYPFAQPIVTVWRRDGTMAEYWNDPASNLWPFLMEYRGALAKEMLLTHPLVAGKTLGEDSSGRAICQLQSVPEVVQRCCDLADRFVGEIERRGWVRMREMTTEEVAERAGRLERIRERMRFEAERVR